MPDLPCLCSGDYRCNQCRTRDWEQTNAPKAAAKNEAAPTSDAIVNRLQTVFTISPNHWVVAMPARGVWFVAEITPQARITHSHHRLRRQAEVVAAAVAAIRTHHTLTAEDTR